MNVRHAFGRLQGRKTLLTVLALVLVLGMVIGGTMALLIANSSKVTNTFVPGEVTGTIEEEKDDDSKNSVKIQNTGNVKAYVRVAVVANEVDETLTKILGPYDVSAYLAGAGWVKHGGFYYYTTPVDPQGKTGELLTGSIPLKVTVEGVTHYYQVTIAAELIQADGVAADGTTKAVVDAWGVDPFTLGGD